jgi:hypothetical protein
MRKITFLIMGLMLSITAFSQTVGDTIIANNSSKLKVKVLYFHITNRCNTCMSIEINVRKTIFENFKTQLDNGEVDLYIVNCELPANKVLSEKYNAYGATFAITTYKDGIELTTEDLSNWAFKKAAKQEVFVSELKDKINELLK